jgi:hypothetical protein
MKGTKPDLTKLTTKKELTDHDEDKKLSDSFSALLALSTKPDDWRARILAVIPQDMYEDMCEAVSFYTDFLRITLSFVVLIVWLIGMRIYTCAKTMTVLYEPSKHYR